MNLLSMSSLGTLLTAAAIEASSRTSRVRVSMPRAASSAILVGLRAVAMT